MGAVVSSDDDARRSSEEDSEAEGSDHESRDSDDDSETDESEEESEDESGDDDDDDESSFFGDSDSDSETTETESEEEEQIQEVIITEGIIVGLGAPLLNIIAQVAPGYLERYKLDAGTEKVAQESEQEIFNELISWFQVNYLPGGEALTTVRVAQWMLQLPKATTAIGAISSDSKGKRCTNLL